MATILLVDDSAEFRVAMAATLASRGHVVIELSDGAGVVGVCEARVIDLVLLDLVMPGVEGIEALAELQRHFPRLPVIAVSGASQGYAYLAAAKMIGAHRTLLKPFSLDELFLAVEEALAGRRRS